MRTSGKIGVVIFFVMSGFLITHLLLAEQKTYNKINIKKFYIRRILRIWPLYFIIIFLAFTVTPLINVFDIPGIPLDTIYKDFSGKLILFLFMFPNLALVIYGVIPYASPSWSIGTEEQYYAVWPMAMRFFKRRQLAITIFIFTFYIVVQHFLSYISSSRSINYIDIVIKYWDTLFLSSLATGGIFAIIFFRKLKILKYFLNNHAFYISLITVIYLIINGKTFTYFNYEIYSFLFGIIILNFAANSNIPITFEFRLFKYLGRISYGLYMYHSIAIVLSFFILKEIGTINDFFLYPLTFILTIVLAGLSYRFSWFILSIHRSLLS